MLKKNIYRIFLIAIVILIINTKYAYGLVSTGLDIEWSPREIEIVRKTHTQSEVTNYMAEHFGYQDVNGKVQNPSVFITTLTYRSSGLFNYVKIADSASEVRVSKKELEQLGYTRRKNVASSFNCFYRRGR